MTRTMACSKFQPLLLLALLFCPLNLMAETTAKEQRHIYVKQSPCRPPLFVFGASLLDVGENAAAMPGRSVSEFPPYGVHYFGRTAARFSNGRLLIDFITQGLGYGFVDPFLKSLGSNFKHGVNFASSGATARNSTISGNGTSSLGLFSLNVQIDQFIEFKRSALGFKDPGYEEKILTEEDVLEGVYLMEFGHNDYINYAFRDPNYSADIFAYETISYFKKALLRLYNEGARKVVVMNLMPLGCAPGVLGYIKPPKELQDEYGCLISYNNMVNLHNNHLSNLLKELRLELPRAEWVLFDWHSVIENAIRHPTRYGVRYPLKTCCGEVGEYNFEWTSQCGSLNATVCEDPTRHIFWDGLHFVDSFNNILGNKFLQGKNLIPKFLIKESCKISK
uniref:SGNH hydrolase-type esterase domain-containing protein n=1 Tax=Picea sitchensis TaxID=3332 RepID=A9P117_PICSI|nr:unknown [Picea sitchensis]